MDTTDLGAGLAVVEIRKDGTVIERHPPVWVDSCKQECCDKWWEESFKCNKTTLYQITVKKIVRSNGTKSRKNPQPKRIRTKQMRQATRVKRLHSRISTQSKWAAKPLPPLIIGEPISFETKNQTGEKRVLLKYNEASKRYRMTDDFPVRDVWMNRLPINSLSRRRFPTLISIRSKVYSR